MTQSTEHIWTLMHDELTRFIKRRIAHADDAADAVQETFIRIHNGLSKLEDEQRVAAWVYRIARNVVTDYYRKKRIDTDDLADALLDTNDDEENLNAVVGGWLTEMIARLPAEYREAVELAEVRGLPQREIADRLGLSLSGVKSRIQRGRAQLRQAVIDCCHVERDGYGNVVGYERRTSPGHCSCDEGADDQRCG